MEQAAINSNSSDIVEISSADEKVEEVSNFSLDLLNGLQRQYRAEIAVVAENGQMQLYKSPEASKDFYIQSVGVLHTYILNSLKESFIADAESANEYMLKYIQVLTGMREDATKVQQSMEMFAPRKKLRM